MVMKSAYIHHAYRGSAGRGEEYDDELLTNPVIWPFATCDDEDLARRAGDGYRATDDAWC